MPSPNAVTIGTDDHHFVEMGPKPAVEGVPTPSWHPLYTPSRHPFPSWPAALAFAKHHKSLDPDRDVVIALPDGRRWDGTEWVE